MIHHAKPNDDISVGTVEETRMSAAMEVNAANRQHQEGKVILAKWAMIVLCALYSRFQVLYYQFLCYLKHKLHALPILALFLMYGK